MLLFELISSIIFPLLINSSMALVLPNNTLLLEAEKSLKFTSTDHNATLTNNFTNFQSVATNQTFLNSSTLTLGSSLSGKGSTLTSSGKCHHRVNGTCVPSLHSPNSLAGLLEALPFLPLLIVLGLMFVCLCLVLRLFSKARFRNNRSSIFVNPKTLKVAQAQERRLSQLSQLSGHSGLRSPRSPRTPNRSPIHSMRSARSSYGSNVYPINDPQLHTPTNSVLMKAKSRSNSISSSKLLP